MWDDITKNLSQFSSAVLTFPDEGGYPYSVRCRPEPDEAMKVLHIEVADSVPIVEGPAGLSSHYHNEELWDLKSFLIRGHVERGENGWLFRPSQFKAGGSVASPIDQIKGMIKARKSTKRYLEKRGLARPEIPWAEYKKLRAGSKAD